MDTERNGQGATEVRQRIGPEIRKLRQRQGLSLSDLAERTEISVSYLSRLEKGRSVPSFTLLSRLGGELDVDIGHFVDTEKEATSVDAKLEELLSDSPVPRELWSEFFGMSVDARKSLIAYIQQLSGDRSRAR